MTRMSQKKPAPVEADDLDAINAESAYWHALSKGGLAKQWWDAEHNPAPIHRALRIDPNDPGAVYAAAPFRLAKIDGRFVILAAWPTPRLFVTPDPDWLGIETVIVWNPVTGEATTPEDPAPQLIGRFPDANPTIYADPFAFFRAWAEQRAGLAIAHQAARNKTWHIGPREFDDPGMLMLGKVEDIRWNAHHLPERFEISGIDPARVNKAILRAAHLPRASARAADLRAAA